MRNILAVLMLFSILIAVSAGQDWLDGGSVGRGNYGDIRQYFTDPIFYSQDSAGSISTDPAIRDMQLSMERTRYPTALGSSTPRQSAARAGITAATTGAVKVAGSWHIELASAPTIDLSLQQSETAVFGRGIISSGVNSRPAVASGDIYLSSLRLDIIPYEGIELYRISLDLSRQPVVGTYTVYRVGTMPSSGVVRTAVKTSGDM
jgi:hypothetical protein